LGDSFAGQLWGMSLRRVTLDAMDLPPATAAVLAEFCAGVRARFGARLDRLALFGSRARGEAGEDSDVDVVAVIDGLTFAEGREVDAMVGDLLTRHDVLLSPLLLSREHFKRLRARERRIVAEIDRDGIPL
jgi:predicted nucleotidyltransferase